jgi:hypothetical protein
MKKVLNRNTHPCVNLKTILRCDRCAKTGKSYLGVLRRDEPSEEFNFDDHFTFLETRPQAAGKRNPHVFRGEFFTITRWADGSLPPNFRPMQIGKNFHVDAYAINVCNELRQALKGLVEEGE